MLKIIIPTADDSNITLQTEIELNTKYGDTFREHNLQWHTSLGSGSDGIHQKIFNKFKIFIQK